MGTCVTQSATDRQDRLIRLARNVNWYEPAEQVAGDTCKLLAEVMARGSLADVVEATELFTKDQFREAYRRAPAGLFGRRHWAYWGIRLFGDAQTLPFPVRFPEAGWEWPSSFQEVADAGPTTAEDINALVSR